ncbi:ABC transporter substrate-binding protein [Flexivirga alba]|uniref:ABC transporter substrate-binding protein n=1 Tax=Flexivirga alba TaxID=702742 RepID=A0ABW2ABY3_9MICO
MKKLTAITTVVVVAAFGSLTGCSSSGGGLGGGASAAAGAGTGTAGSGANSGGTVHVGTIPNPSSIAVYLGKQQKMFGDVNVETKVATGFAPNLAAVVNGESQVGFAAVIPLMVAVSKGAPIKIVAGTDRTPAKYDAATDPDNVFVSAKSSIKSASDLEGKTVAVTALGSIQDLGIKITVKKAGGDPSKVKFLSLGSADMIAALKAGRVDAVALSEPFTSEARNDKLTPLFSYATSPMPGLPVGAYFTSVSTLSKDSGSLSTFVSGIKKATAYAQANPDKVKAALPGYTGIPAKVANKVSTFPYTTDITPAQIAKLSALLKEYGYTSKSVTAQQILP